LDIGAANGGSDALKLPGEVGGRAVDDVVVLPLHLQERAVLAAVLPELQTRTKQQSQTEP
jgi:hypothetical protein